LEEIAARAAVAIDNAQLHAAAEAAVAGRDEYISVAAHDLRTPIASLRGYAQLALRYLDADDPDLERVRKSVTHVLEQTTRLTRMMERLLDVARLEGGKVRLEPAKTDIATLVGEVVAACQAARPERDIVLRTEPVWACVDPVRLEQVVTNLLDNALKFSPADTPVEVEVELAPGDPDQVRITVRDYGHGIPVERRARLFERYFQAHEPHADLGVGLGLYISRHFVELHGGSIAVESPPDGGSRFVVLIPTGGTSSVPVFANVDDYIAAQSAAVQPRLRELRAIIRAAVPDATEVISYGMPTYKFRIGAVYFGAARNHCALYGSAMDLFADELRGFDTSKGTLRFPLDQPIPEDLVRRLVIATVAQRAAASHTA
jgi:uncharacterized protein YdhG (YjbR/CyaY superfamily)/nitrogen-specific signal transduction histidine kinase